MKKFITLLIIALVSVCIQIYGQNVPQEEKPKSEFVRKLTNLIKNDASKVDTNYIAVPDRQWLFMLNSTFSKMNIDIKTPDIYATQAVSDAFFGLLPVDFNMGRIKIDGSTPLSYRLGFYLSYGKLGGGYSMALTHHNDQEYNFRFNGNRFGMDMRYHRTKKMEGEFEFENIDQIMEEMFTNLVTVTEEQVEEWEERMEKMEETEEVEQGSIQTSSLICNMHYVFNHRKFSYAAAMKPKKIQLRSSGSWLLGSSIYYSQFKVVEKDLIQAFNGIHKFNSYFFALGGGYGYNWVTCKHKLMFHGSIMPMLMYSLKSDAKLANREMTPAERENLKEVTKKYLGGRSNFTYAGVARASAVYQINDRYVAGLDGTFDIFKIGRSPRYETLARDLIFHAYVGCRF